MSEQFMDPEVQIALLGKGPEVFYVNQPGAVQQIGDWLESYDPGAILTFEYHDVSDVFEILDIGFGSFKARIWWKFGDTKASITKEEILLAMREV